MLKWTFENTIYIWQTGGGGGGGCFLHILSTSNSAPNTNNLRIWMEIQQTCQLFPEREWWSWLAFSRFQSSLWCVTFGCSERARMSKKTTPWAQVNYEFYENFRIYFNSEIYCLYVYLCKTNQFVQAKYLQLSANYKYCSWNWFGTNKLQLIFKDYKLHNPWGVSKLSFLFSFF